MTADARCCRWYMFSEVALPAPAAGPAPILAAATCTHRQLLVLRWQDRALGPTMHDASLLSQLLSVPLAS